MIRTLRRSAVLLLVSASLQAQTIEDGEMMPKGDLCTGFLYTFDRWSEYWEGTLKRDNANVGTLTTQSVMWMGAQGVTDRLNVIAMLPYVRTKASGGTLKGQSGLQNVTVAAKYRLWDKAFAQGDSSLKTFVGASYSQPVSDYIPDLLPLSIGMACKGLSSRVTANYKTKNGWYANASAAYTWRGEVTLDRPAYYTEGRLFLTDQVAMPNAFDYAISAGYAKGRLYVPVTFAQLRTRGGGDIRRQDMPFPSNRMNVSRLDAVAKYMLSKPNDLTIQVGATQALSGRNVGQSTTLTAGLLYTIHFSR